MINMWYNLINQIDNFLGLGKHNSEIVLFVLCLLLIIVIFIVLISMISKKSIKVRQKLVYQYDNIIYLISAYNYQTNTKNSLDIMKQILDQKNPSYEESHSKIVKSIKDIENSLGKKIVPQNDWKIIKRLRSQLDVLLFCNKVLKILLLLIIISMLSVFVYNRN